MRLRDFKLAYRGRFSNLPSYSHSIVITLYSLSPLFPSQVNNSSSFTYPTSEFIMEIILFVSSLVLVLGKVQAPRRWKRRWVERGGGKKGKKNVRRRNRAIRERKRKNENKSTRKRHRRERNKGRIKWRELGKKK